MASANLQIAVSKVDKYYLDTILNENIGISYSQAINLFLKQLVLEAGIPFDVTLPIPNDETLEAMFEEVDLSEAMTFEEFCNSHNLK